MAYGNYEGKVFRNGEHHHANCDGEVRVRRYDGKEHMFHALLGDGRVRVGLRKTFPMLLVEGDDGVFDEPITEDFGQFDGAREVDGFRAYAHSIGNHATATLIEPDGTVWTGMSGYDAYDGWCEDDR